jgi:hypothetical protein
MPSQAMAGFEGNFALTGYNFRVAEWSATVVRDVNDITGFSSGQFRENIGGVKGLRGSASGYLLSDGASTAIGAPMGTADYVGSAFTLTYTASTRGTCTMTGTAIVSMVGVGTGVNGVGTASIGFVATGAFTETWDVTG